MTFKMKRLLAPSFLLAALILLVSAIGLQWVVHSFEVFLSKKQLPLRRQLYLMPMRFGPCLLENEEPELTPEIEAVLGAEAYITREYRDTRVSGSEDEALLRLHIAYFTGTPDAVIHVPEVCYVAGGAQGQTFEQEVIGLDSPFMYDGDEDQLFATSSQSEPVRLPGRQIPLRVFEFVPQGAADPRTVCYFFAANGRYMGSPEQVRTLVLDVRDEYAYWCKIEVLPMGARNREDALKAVSDFLSYALPEVMACLPDWHDVKAGTYPPAPTATSPEMITAR